MKGYQIKIAGGPVFHTPNESSAIDYIMAVLRKHDDITIELLKDDVKIVEYSRKSYGGEV